MVTRACEKTTEAAFNRLGESENLVVVINPLSHFFPDSACAESESSVFYRIKDGESASVDRSDPAVQKVIQNARRECLQADAKINQILQPEGARSEAGCRLMTAEEFNEIGKGFGVQVESGDRFVDAGDTFSRANEYGEPDPYGANILAPMDPAVLGVMHKFYKRCAEREKALSRLLGATEKRVDAACRRISVKDFNEFGEGFHVLVKSQDSMVDARDHFYWSDGTGLKQLDPRSPEVGRVVKNYQDACELGEYFKREVSADFDVTIGPAHWLCACDRSNDKGDIVSVYSGGEPLFKMSSRVFLFNEHFGPLAGNRFFARRQLAVKVARSLDEDIPVQYRPELTITPEAKSLIEREGIVIDEARELIHFPEAMSKISSDFFPTVYSYAGAESECGFNEAVRISVEEKDPDVLVFEYRKEDGAIEIEKFDVKGRWVQLVRTEDEPGNERYKDLVSPDNDVHL